MKLAFKNATWLVEQIDKAIAREDKEWEEYIAQWKFNLLTKERTKWWGKKYFLTEAEVEEVIKSSLNNYNCHECWVRAQCKGRLNALCKMRQMVLIAKERDATVELSEQDYKLIFQVFVRA